MTTKTQHKATAQAAPVVKLFVGAPEIDKAIASIKSRGTKLDSMIQVVGLSIIAHVEAHGDTTLADRLFNAMPKGSRRNALAEWLIAFGKMRVLTKSNKDDAEAIKNGRVFAFDKTKTTDYDTAKDTPWYDMRPEQEVSTAFDVQKAVQSLIKRIQAAKDNGLSMEHSDEAKAALATALDML